MVHTEKFHQCYFLKFTSAFSKIARNLRNLFVNLEEHQFCIKE